MWRMATVEEALDNIQSVWNEICERKLVICALVNGKVTGPALGFKVEWCHYNPEMDHKLLINRKYLDNGNKIGVQSTRSLLADVSVIGVWHQTPFPNIFPPLQNKSISKFI